jgi:hypothetical protein
LRGLRLWIGRRHGLWRGPCGNGSNPLALPLPLGGRGLLRESWNRSNPSTQLDVIIRCRVVCHRPAGAESDGELIISWLACAQHITSMDKYTGQRISNIMAQSWLGVRDICIYMYTEYSES